MVGALLGQFNHRIFMSPEIHFAEILPVHICPEIAIPPKYQQPFFYVRPLDCRDLDHVAESSEDTCEFPSKRLRLLFMRRILI